MAYIYELEVRMWEAAKHRDPEAFLEVVSEFKIRRSSVTSGIQGLEKHGLVERRSVSTDALRGTALYRRRVCPDHSGI